MSQLNSIQTGLKATLLEPELTHGSISISIQSDAQSPAETKLRPLFQSLDIHGTGSVSFKQVSEYLELTLANAKLELVDTDIQTVTGLLFAKANATGSSLAFPEFCSVLGPYIVDPHDSKSLTSAKDRHRKFAEWYDKNRLRVWWTIGYIIANIVAFWWAFYSYKYDPALRMGLRIARGGAKIAILNAFLVMVPVLRSPIRLLKQSKTLWRYVPFDDAMLAHKVCGTMCLVGGAIHVGAHISNIIHLYFISTPDELRRSIFGQRDVAVFRNGLPPFTTLLGTQPVWTGVVLVVISLISFPLAAIDKVRQRRFNLFWYSHMLFGVMLVLLCVHDAASWVVRATSYVWIVPVVTMYLVERRYRYTKIWTDPVQIVNAVALDHTFALYLEKPRRFAFRPGMYLLINCPTVSYHEWHPFTISSAPDDQYLGVHIRNAGDWTAAFHKVIAECQKTGSLEYPTVYLDGPVGAPTEDYHRYETVICVAGGIGVTPFASILKYAVYRLQNGCLCQNAKSRKLYFHWMTRGQDSLRWFEHTMNQISKLDRDEIIEAHQYLTPIRDDSLSLQAVQQLVYDMTGKDVVSGLRSKTLTHLGHPNWDQIFQEACRRHMGQKIGVFSCGPRGMEIKLEQMCKKYSYKSEGGTVFEYHPERFA